MTANPPQPGMPPAPRVRVEGTVTAVHADGRFTLALSDGNEMTGTAPGDQLRTLGRSITARVLVLGVNRDGVFVSDGVVPLDAPVGRHLSETEISEFVSRARRATPGESEATEDEMDALIRDDR